MRRLFLVAMLLMAVCAIAQAQEIKIHDWDDLENAFARYDNVIDWQTRVDGEFWEYTFSIEASSDISLYFDEMFLVNKASGGNFSLGTSDAKVVRPGEYARVACRQVIQNDTGDPLTLDFINGLSDRYVVCAWYHDRTVVSFTTPTALNLGADSTRLMVTDGDAPSPAEMAAQLAEYQQWHERRSSTGTSTHVNPDDDDEAPELYAPAFVQKGNWIYPTNNKKSLHLIVTAPTDYFASGLSVAYELLLQPSLYGESAHYIMGDENNSCWVRYHCGRDSVVVPDEFVAVDDNERLVTTFNSYHSYRISPKDSLEYGLVTGAGDLQQKIRRIMAVYPGLMTGSRRVRKLDDLQEHRFCEFYFAGNTLRLPTDIVQVDIVRHQYCPHTERLYVNNERFNAAMYTGIQHQPVLLRADPGKSIGYIRIYEANPEEMLDWLANLNRDLTPEEEERLNKILATK